MTDDLSGPLQVGREPSVESDHQLPRVTGFVDLNNLVQLLLVQANRLLDEYGDLYTEFKTNMATGRYDLLNFDDLKLHFGQNPGNQLNSPLWVHMAAGLGSGLFLFDENGCAVNPLDENEDRFGCEGVAPATNFAPNRARNR